MEYLYHGTNFGSLDQIMSDGILPRNRTGGKNRWGEYPSREDCVYLSRLYAPYFALGKSEEGERWLLIRVKKRSLIEDILLPDEDYAAQILPESCDDMSLAEKTELARKILPNISDKADHSIKYLGNCAYMGPITPSQIDKIVSFSLEENPFFNCAVDPTITIMNAQFMGDKYTAITEWFFEDPTEEGLLKVMRGQVPDENTSDDIKRGYEKTREHWFSRKGLEVVYER